MEFFAIIWEIILIIFLAAKVLISELYNIIKQSLQTARIYADWNAPACRQAEIHAENNKLNPDDGEKR